MRLQHAERSGQRSSHLQAKSGHQSFVRVSLSRGRNTYQGNVLGIDLNVVVCIIIHGSSRDCLLFATSGDTHPFQTSSTARIHKFPIPASTQVLLDPIDRLSRESSPRHALRSTHPRKTPTHVAPGVPPWLSTSLDCGRLVCATNWSIEDDSRPELCALGYALHTMCRYRPVTLYVIQPSFAPGMQTVAGIQYISKACSSFRVSL